MPDIRHTVPRHTIDIFAPVSIPDDSTASANDGNGALAIDTAGIGILLFNYRGHSIIIIIIIHNIMALSFSSLRDLNLCGHGLDDGSCPVEDSLERGAADADALYAALQSLLCSKQFLAHPSARILHILVQLVRWNCVDDGAEIA